MASLPPRPASQRRQSPARDNQSEPQAPRDSPVRTRSVASEDSQTLFLNPPTEAEQQADTQEDAAPKPGIKRSDTSSSSVKKCWICFSDSTEDTPETSPWRDPCPCALQAHEECLLDWIADMEAPNQRRSKQLSGQKILCPQCKSEIKLARPRDYVVDIVRGLERWGQRAVTPGSIMVLTSVVYGSSVAHGIHTVYSIFGAEDGFRILWPLVQDAVRPKLEIDSTSGYWNQIGETLIDRLQHWRLYVGLPLITPMLVLSRTSLADSILPVLPILFFATQTSTPGETFDFGRWPPSASLAFSLLPYARSAYNVYYERCWAEREKKWLKEIQPRNGQEQGQGGDGDGQEGEANPADQEVAADENVFEVRIDGGIWEEWEDGEADEDWQRQLQQQPQPEMAQGENHEEPQQEGDEAAPAPNIADNRPQQNGEPAEHHHHHHHEIAQGQRRLSFSPIAIAETVLGALAFPTICEASGELLKLVLPKAWTLQGASLTSTGLYRRSAPTGFFQQKWARSLVGGCLFVIFKDTIMLYVRWRMAQMHRKRRVLDYDKSQKRGSWRN